MKTFNNFVMIKMDLPETKIGSIEIPVIAQNAPQSGVVISDSNYQGLKGKRIFFPHYAAIEFNKDERTFIIDMKEVWGEE